MIAYKPQYGRTLAAAAGLTALAALAALTGRGAPLQPGEGSRPAAAFAAAELALREDDRILILSPHPDDETIACGGVIQRALGLGLPVRIVFLTYGDANEWSFILYRKRPELLPRQVRAMGLVRHDEALAADHILGLPPEQLTFLGYPDFGTLAIWAEHWGDEPPLHSIFARAAQVPYANAYRPGAAYKGEEILADLKAAIQKYAADYGAPTKIFLSHPADHNVDHAALYAFTRIALWDLGMKPELYSYLVHSPGWPQPRGLRPADALTPPAGLIGQETWTILPLTRPETDRKLAALEAHRTQYGSNARYLSSFIRGNELFGGYPDAAVAASGRELSLETTEPDQTRPEGLTDAEQIRFVGTEWRTVRLEGDDLILSVALSKPLAEGVTLSTYLFGYRSDRPFAAMPKIHVEVGALSTAVYDQSRKLHGAAVQVRRDARAIVMRAPLALLGEPERALVAAHTYLGDVPLDAAAWRVLDLSAARP